jgi:hypothetical protein
LEIDSEKQMDWPCCIADDSVIATHRRNEMTKITAAQKLIDAVKAAGTIEFTVGAGSGNTLHTLDALRRKGFTPVKIGGQWQSKGGMQFRLTA